MFTAILLVLLYLSLVQTSALWEYEKYGETTLTFAFLLGPLCAFVSLIPSLYRGVQAWWAGGRRLV